MRKDTAMSRLRRALADATEDQARDVADILRLGAGDIWHEGAILTEPADIPADRRWAYVSLAEAIQLAPGDDWPPRPRGGLGGCPRHPHPGGRLGRHPQDGRGAAGRHRPRQSAPAGALLAKPR
jgi:hypothetical protein